MPAGQPTATGNGAGVPSRGLDRAMTTLVAVRHLATEALSALLTDQLLADAPDDDVALLLHRSPS